ncbi:Zn-ribbon domain-containing OB-fold protein [Hwanghaeella sp.]|uniref:Zn-ribbon domain-containing OB-fold protein n=1 Tax=Hwanghaeella sp. TaxID=2605943 RepID=UPI003CCBB386
MNNEPDGPTGPQAAYEAFLKQGRFMIQKSASTGEYVFYPRVCSPSGAQDLEWVEASGRGTVYAATMKRGRDGATSIVLIDLEEGPRMMSTIAGDLDLPIGTKVIARVETTGDQPRVVFDPVPNGEDGQ